MNRRQFIAASAVSAATSTTLSAKAKAPARNPFCFFSKPFQSLSYDDLADLVAELGFDGIEGTVRPGGHITPEQVPDELPKMVEALLKRKLELTIMASGINNADDKLNLQQLRVAAKLSPSCRHIAGGKSPPMCRLQYAVTLSSTCRHVAVRLSSNRRRAVNMSSACRRPAVKLSARCRQVGAKLQSSCRRHVAAMSPSSCRHIAVKPSSNSRQYDDMEDKKTTRDRRKNKKSKRN